MRRPRQGKLALRIDVVRCGQRAIVKGGKTLKPRTVAGLMAGGALGIALGAGLMMMPQGRHVRKALERGANGLGKSVTGLMK